MKKIKDTGLFIIILLFSFFVTNYWVQIGSKKDPLMGKIVNISNKYNKEAISAKIIGNKMISGLTGREIDYKKSYYNMHKYGNYNEGLIELKEVKPVISIDNHFDKYIVRGNPNKREIALVFLVSDTTLLDDVESILKQKKETGTFFIEDSLLDKSVINNSSRFEYEIYNEDNSYNEELFKSAISYLKNISHNSGNYCFNRREDNSFLELCSKLKLHSIKPTIYFDKNMYHEIKNNLANSIIISMPINKVIVKELSASIDYIKSHGYKLVRLDSLIQE